MKRDRAVDEDGKEGSAQSALPMPLRPNKPISVPRATPVSPAAPFTNKRPRSLSANSKNSSAANTAAKRRDLLSPVTYLQSLQPPTASKTKRYHGVTFARPRDEDLAAYDTKIVSALRSSDVAKLRAMRQGGKSMNACNQFGESLLHMACRRGDVEVVRVLVKEFQVRVDVRDDYGRTPLHDACWTTTPNFEVMDILIDAVDPMLLLAEDVRGHTPFDYARREHWELWLRFLKERKERLLKRLEVKVVA